MKPALMLVLGIVVLAHGAAAQQPYPGNTLITPLRSTETFLIDLSFNHIQSWTGTNGAGHTVYLLPDNSVLRGQGDPNAPLRVGGGAGGHLQRIDANNNIVWDYFFSNSLYQHHHDIAPMPNGNVLVIAWEVRTPAEAVAMGFTGTVPNPFFPTLIAELQPVGSNDANVVWEWHAWDHMIQDTDPAKPNFGVIADHPERIDVNRGSGVSFFHVNFVDYDPYRDEIVLCSSRLSEVLVIDHSTTTAEAAGSTGGNSGKGGDILYRWGNPQNYGRGTVADRVLWSVHGANRVDELLPGAGNIIAFNNGNRDGTINDHSSVVEIKPPRDANGDYFIAPGQPYGPAVPDWEYQGGANFFSTRYGSGFRMPNGNTLICNGVAGIIFEVMPDGTSVWAYLEPAGNGVFAAERYWGPVTVTSALDLYPATCPNLFDTDPLLPAAILGSDILNVAFIDVSTLRLEGVAPLSSGVADVAGPDAGGPCDCTTDGADGHADLTLEFSRDDIAAALGSGGGTMELTLEGNLKDGTPFKAKDCLIEPIVPVLITYFAAEARGGVVELRWTISADEAVEGLDIHRSSIGGATHSILQGRLLNISDRHYVDDTIDANRRYEYMLVVRKPDGSRVQSPRVTVDVPAVLTRLLGNYPNPFNPTTTIAFDLAERDRVTVTIYDVAGAVVATVADRQFPQGRNEVTWDGRGAAGQRVASGVYPYTVRVGKTTLRDKMQLLK
jgi:hypothetical protein